MFSLLLYLYSPLSLPRTGSSRRVPSIRSPAVLRGAEPSRPPTPGPLETAARDSRKRRAAKKLRLRAIEGGRTGVP